MREFKLKPQNTVVQSEIAQDYPTITRRSMIFRKMELCQSRENMHDASVYDLRRTRSLPSENEVAFINNNIERGSRSPIVHRESTEYASDSSCEGYRDYQKQQIERRNSSPINISSAFTIDSILGRNEKRDQTLRTDSFGDKEEDQDETDDRIEGHFVRPTAIPAARPGETL